MKNKIITVTLNPCIDKTIEINCFEAGMVNRISASRTDAGGKGINVSRVLADSDAKTIALGVVGGVQGKLLEDILTKENVEYDFIHRQEETRTNLKIYDPVTKNTTDINELGAYLSEEILKTFTQRFKVLLSDCKVLVLAGSVPPGCDGSIYAIFINIAKEYDVKVILDADGELFLNGIEAVPSVIKPNIHELEALYGHSFKDEKEMLSYLKVLLDKGIELIVVSMGKDGALFYTKEKILRAKALDVDVKSTVGCGDSMVAAIAYSIVQNFDLEKMSKSAIAAGSLTAGKDGTNMCRISEALDRVSDVEIEIIFKHI